MVLLPFKILLHDKWQVDHLSCLFTLQLMWFRSINLIINLKMWLDQQEKKNEAKIFFSKSFYFLSQSVTNMIEWLNDFHCNICNINLNFLLFFQIIAREELKNTWTTINLYQMNMIFPSVSNPLALMIDMFFWCKKSLGEKFKVTG